MSRVGIGYDVHKLVTDRKLILGGVDIPHEKGLLGHSDADVLLHAISDALLGAAALGDIGKHFPDTDERFKGISSLILLKHVGELLQAKNYKINNIDATIVAQRPKLLPFIPTMQKNVAETLNLSTFEKIKHIEFPGALPAVFTGLRLGFGYSWRALVSAELIAASSGLGYLISDASEMARTDQVFVGIFMIAILGILGDFLFQKALFKVAPWSKK